MTMKTVLLTASAMACAVTAAPASAGDIRFYASNGCRGPVIFRYPVGIMASDNCKKGGNRCSGRNDAARSLWLPDAGPWSLIVYDSPSAEKDDDYAEIKATGRASPGGGVCVASFQRRSANVTYYAHNGLDGKVSHIAVNSIRLR